MTFLSSSHAPVSALVLALALSVGCNDLLGLQASTIEATDGGVNGSSGESATGSSGASSATGSSSGTGASGATASGASGDGSSGASGGGSGGNSASGSGSTSSGNMSSGAMTSGSSGASNSGSGSGASGASSGSGSGASGASSGSRSGASGASGGSGASAGSSSGSSDAGTVCKPPAKGTLAFAQVATARSPGTQAEVSATFPGAQTACNWIVLSVGWHDISASVLHVTDTAGDTFRLLIGKGAAFSLGTSLALYYAGGIRAAGANTVTVTFDAAAGMATSPNLRAVEYAGITDVDLFNYTFGAGVTAGPSTPTPAYVTLTNPQPEIVFGAGIWDGTLTKAGSGFTLRNALGGDAIVEDLFTTGRGTFGPGATFTVPPGGGEYILHTASFY